MGGNLIDKSDLKKLVSMYYDIQDIRIRTENRIRQLNVDYGIDPYFLRKMELIISDRIKEAIKDEPIYKHFLSKIKGIGPILSGAVIAYFDPHKADHPSSFWRYAGLHVVDGRAPRRTRGAKIDWNPKVKTLCWKIGMSFIKFKTPFYSDLYYDYREAENVKLNFPLSNPTQCKLYNECPAKRNPPCKMHIHLRALRKTVKRFLVDLWLMWRKLEGLPLSKPYPIGILGHDPLPKSPYVDEDIYTWLTK